MNANLRGRLKKSRIGRAKDWWLRAPASGWLECVLSLHPAHSLVLAATYRLVFPWCLEFGAWSFFPAIHSLALATTTESDFFDAL